jgi:uncharacterized protein YjbI with pentapeptide repeats
MARATSTSANLTSAILRQANLTNADFWLASLNDADLVSQSDPCVVAQRNARWATLADADIRADFSRVRGCPFGNAGGISLTQLYSCKLPGKIYRDFSITTTGAILVGQKLLVRALGQLVEQRELRG